ncbi:FAD/NAD(P)-binding protein [Yinghuangia seranimata]|uniref:FAD/NAD(P)-binding protein n=1 Tax=Yinghuangia seranimata TaxID=408067 RepID=UPI00248CC5FA|nr:FAD/NAD(P)-binding protein [Yinghuangia seranimata]MDI2130930.1 FAD/NAD(P)-binding protein [Yinghuangia seranimata]
MTNASPARKSIAIIGAGPRGLSVLERLCANERSERRHTAVSVHLIDPYDPGAGAVWRPDQSRLLLMNTVASQITVFTDASSRIEGPIEPGPSLYEWARGVAAVGGGYGYTDETTAEARDLGPDTYPTRALYGDYLRAMFHRIVADAPTHVTVTVHRTLAVALGGRDTQRVRLRQGGWLGGLDAVVLAQGHVPSWPTHRERRNLTLADTHGLVYLTPANPADLDLGAVAPGGGVLLRGLGLGFFDFMALLTAGRGGTFTREHGRLRYRPSGYEPRLYATSRRGIPYHARGRNEKGPYGRYSPRLLTADHAARLRERSAAGEWVRFGTDVWPLVAREVEAVYYETLLRGRGRADAAEELGTRYLAARGPDEHGLLLDKFGVGTDERWDWQRLAHPWREREFADRGDFRTWLLAYLRRDVREAEGGNVGNPLKAAVDVLRDLRNEVRLVVDHAGLEGASHRDELQRWYTPLNAFLSIGPPISRIEEMIALVEAGVLELIGPEPEIRVDTEAAAFVATSPLVPGPPVRAKALIEARLPEPDIRCTSDPLLQYLLGTGQAATYRVPSADAPPYETGGLAVTPRPNRLVDGHGRPHPRRFAYGVPTESVHWVTAAGIRPGVDSVALADSDAIARSVLRLPEPTDATEEARPLEVIV